MKKKPREELLPEHASLINWEQSIAPLTNNVRRSRNENLTSIHV
jgi:hypothetical protein